jgi:hypothetical protein
MYMLKSAHDCLGNWGAFATRDLLSLCFWWPAMDKDVHWYCQTCHIYQERQKLMIKAPGIVTFTPSVFQVGHVDTAHMPVTSNRHKRLFMQM